MSVATPERVAPTEVAALPPATPRRSNLHTLDLLRALAALGVVAFHFRPFAAGALDVSLPATVVGDAGVPLFFVLSGFLIGVSVVAPTRFSGRRYVVNRVTRILPNYWFSIVVVVVVLHASALFTLDGVKDVTAHVFLVHGLFPDYRTSMHAVWWTLSIEWQFYAVMLLLAGALRRDRLRWVMAGGMVLVGVAWRVELWRRHATSPADLNYGYKQLPGTFDLFGCGLLAALALQVPAARAWVARPVVRAAGLAAGVAGLVAVLVVYRKAPPGIGLYWRHQGMVLWWPLAFGVAAGTLVLFIQQFERELGPWIRRSGLAFVGVISYSVYLYHPLVLHSVGVGYRDAGGAASPWLVAGLVLGGTIGLAAVTYYLVEQPFMRMRTPSTTARALRGVRGMRRTG